MKADKIYKVVFLEFDGHYYSASIQGKAKVKYVIGKYVRPPKWLRNKGYGLTAFSSLEDAKKFLIENRHEIIFEAIGLNKLELKPFCSLFALHKGIIISSDILWPKGTCMYEKIKIIKPIT